MVGLTVRFFSTQRGIDERLLWSRDIRYLHRLAEQAGGARLLELASGGCLIGPAATLTDAIAAEVAGPNGPEYGLANVDGRHAEAERYVVALAEAVQTSGIADRIGMSQSAQVIQTKMLDLHVAMRASHAVAFQPIVDLGSRQAYEYECLFRPAALATGPVTISAMVDAAIATGRAVEFDALNVRIILERLGEIQASRSSGAGDHLRFAVNFIPATLLDPQFEARAFAEQVAAAGLSPRQITVECTEQQAVRDGDVGALTRQAKALRRLGFGFAVDDAGAGYASFTMIAALRPSIIKIDREIVRGIATREAKQALVEAFVSFARRIEARLIAEGIETRAELGMLRSLGVAYGQGYLLGRPNPEPLPPRSFEPRRGRAAGSVGEAVAPADGRRPRPRILPTTLD
jgi:EAL domain-containing protein (putative c-di-GMP-specific phosphodiesterase class I)